MQRFDDVDSVKLDLIASRGIAYVKFKSASSAARAKEDIDKHNIVRLLCVYDRVFFVGRRAAQPETMKTLLRATLFTFMCLSVICEQLHCCWAHYHGHACAPGMLAHRHLAVGPRLPSCCTHVGPVLLHSIAFLYLQIAGKRVAAVVADPKTRHGSVTPTDSRLGSRHNSASGLAAHGEQHNTASPGERLDCNPAFWAWVSSQGVPSLDSVEAVHKWHAAWQQEGCPTPQVGGGGAMASFSNPTTLNSSVHSAASSALMHGAAADDNVRAAVYCAQKLRPR